MWDHSLGALATYKRIITIASCRNIVSGFVTSFLVSYPVPVHHLWSVVNIQSLWYQIMLWYQLVQGTVWDPRYIWGSKVHLGIQSVLGDQDTWDSRYTWGSKVHLGDPKYTWGSKVHSGTLYGFLGISCMKMTGIRSGCPILYSSFLFWLKILTFKSVCM